MARALSLSFFAGAIRHDAAESLACCAVFFMRQSFWKGQAAGTAIWRFRGEEYPCGPVFSIFDALGPETHRTKAKPGSSVS